MQSGKTTFLHYELTRGQPLLVNYLCKKCVWQLCPKGEPVGIEQIKEARELLITFTLFPVRLVFPSILPDSLCRTGPP